MIKPAWEIWATSTARSNVVEEWLGRDQSFRARIDSVLRRLKHLPVWPMPTLYRNLGGGVGEIRIDYRNVEHRIYGFFGTRKWTALSVSSDKKRQNADIQEAKQLKKQYDRNPWKTEKYDV